MLGPRKAIIGVISRVIRDGLMTSMDFESFAPPFDIGVGSASAYVLALIVGAIAIGYVKSIYRRVQ